MAFPRRRGGLGAAVAVMALACATQASARPLTLEDVLQREAFGRTAVTSTWIFAEIRGPYVAAARFDDEARVDLLRTTLHAAPVATPGRLRPLFPPEPGAGYALGPVSPGGDQVAVFRLTAGTWELGVARPATGAVAWLGVTPDITATGRSVAWQGEAALVVLATAAGELPLALKLARWPAYLPARREITSEGGVSATVIGAGRHRDVGPRAPDRRLLRIPLATGAPQVLARGPFTDVELSPDGRRAALLAEGGDIPLVPGQAVQGDRGIETRRRRLRLLDLASGRIVDPCAACDVLGQLLRWSPASDALLVFARPDGATWTDGRLLRVRASDGAVRAVGPGVRPVVAGRPPVVRAGWMGRDPIVFARPVGGVGAGRADWFRLAGDRAVNLTGRLPIAPAAAAALWDGALWLAAEGRIWRVAPDGAAPVSLPEATALGLVTPPADGLRLRTELDPREAPPAVVTRRDGATAVRLAPGGAAARLPPGAQALAAGAAGAVIRTPPGGGPEVLAWAAPGLAPVRLAALNARLADVDPPRVRPVRHSGPRGEALTSWLMLPPQPTPGPPSPNAPPPGLPSSGPPPLVVWPYPGAAYPAFPTYLDARAGGGIETPALLVGQGYAVLIPSLPAPENTGGPAEGLAARLLAIVDAAAAAPATRGTFDPDRLAIWGASFGGYGTLAILAQTDRFRAAIVQGAPADLASMHGDFGLKRLAFPEGGPGASSAAGWTEDLQGDMRGPPASNPDRYVRNSPVFAAGRITTPLMIFHGELDTIPIGQAQEMFSSLQRQDKDVVLVTYWGEGHRFASPGTLRDYHRRAFDWLARHITRTARAGHPATPSPGPAPALASSGPSPPPWPPPSPAPRPPGG